MRGPEKIPKMEFFSTRENHSEGFTLIEVVVVTALVLVLSLAAVPMVEIIQQREKEERLQETLIDLRGALDSYRQYNEKFPASFGTLLNTQKPGGGVYLRSFPINPILASPEWEIAATTSISGIGDVWHPCRSPDDVFPGNHPIVDIRCPDVGTGINGIPYKDW